MLTGMAEFDAYLIVDWSASARPVDNKDSIWYCLQLREGDKFAVSALENPRTRHCAAAEIANKLVRLYAEGRHVLAGFDFVVRPTGLPGTDHRQYIYVLQRSRCGHKYGANGSDIHLRRCPKCDGGAPGLPF